VKIDYNIQKLANQFRTKNGIANTEPIRFKSWLIKLKVLAVFKPLSENFSGMALKQNEERFILINTNHSLGKQHFTIAHELYHLFIQEDFQSMVCNTGIFDKKNKIEYEADIFASYLILPEDGLINLMPKEELQKNKITLATMLEIEQYFACSRGALLNRLVGLDLIDLNKYEKYKVGVGKSALEYGKDISLYRPGNANLVIGEYGAKTKKLFENEIISEGHYLSLLNDIGIDIENYNQLADE
jgi:Zn-dependent peptidase ImmA (M78 family)